MDYEEPFEEEESDPGDDTCPSGSSSSDGDGANPEVVLKQSFGHFKIHKQLGRGGMGTVYQARQSNPDRWVAVKMIQAGGFATQSFRRRFKQEADATARLKHPNIVSVYEAGEIDEVPYFTMPLLDGPALPGDAAGDAEELRGRVRLLLKVVDAVGHAHQRGILHRDLKPANILLDREGEPYVADFGLAKLMDGSPDLTMPGAVLGSPSSMAPEQAAGSLELVSTATDVYGLGTILYQLLTGRAPFEAGNTAGVIKQILDTEPVSPEIRNPIVDGDLAAICLTCLEKESSARYPSAEALHRDLSHWLNEEPIEARPISNWGRMVKWARRSPAIAGLAGALSLALVIGGSAFGIQYGKTQKALAQYFDQLVELKIREAEQVSTEGDPAVALAHWAALQRFDPGNTYAARRIQDLLINRNFARPLRYRSGAPLVAAKYYADVDTIVAVDKVGTVALRNGRSLTERRIDITNGEVVDVDLSPGRGELAIAMNREEVVIFDLDDLTVKDRVETPGSVIRLRFNHSGDRIFLQDDAFSLHLWDQTNRRRIELEGMMTVSNHYSFVGRAKFDDSGAKLAGYCLRHIGMSKAKNVGGQFFVWNSSDGQEIFATDTNIGRVRDFAFHPDGDHIAIPQQETACGIWNLASGERVGDLLKHPSGIRKVVFDREGLKLATACSDRRVRVWDLAAGELLAEIANEAYVQSLRFHDDSNRLLVVTADHRAQVWDVSAREYQFEDVHMVDAIDDAWFANDEDRLLSISVAGNTALWETRKDSSLALVPTRVASLDYGAEGSRLVGGTYGSNAIVWKVNGREATVEQILAHNWKVDLAKFDPTGSRIIIGGRGGCRLWGLAADEKWNIRYPGGYHQDWVISIALSPDGEMTLTGSKDTKAVLWSTDDGRSLGGPYKHQGWVEDSAFAPDGSNFVTGSSGGRVSLWRRGNLKRTSRRQVRGRVNRLGYSPDGSIVYCADTAGDLTLWLADELESDAHEGVVLKHHFSVQSVDFHPNGKRMVTASSDGAVRIWDIASQLQIGEAMMHERAVIGARFTPDGRSIVSWSTDGTARVWDAERQRAWSSPLAITGGIASGALSPDGIHFAAGGGRHSVRIWQVDGFPAVEDPEALAKEAEAIGGFRLNDAGQVISIPLAERFRERVQD